MVNGAHSDIKSLNRMVNHLASGHPASSYLFFTLDPCAVIEGFGLNFYLSESAISSLKEKQCRPSDPSSGRMPGLIALFGDNWPEFVRRCNESAKGLGTGIVSNKTGDVISGTEGRGTIQFALDLFLAMKLGNSEGKPYILRAQQRVLKGFRKHHHGSGEYLKIKERFLNAGVPENDSNEFASVPVRPPGISLVGDLLFLITGTSS